MKIKSIFVVILLSVYFVLPYSTSAQSLIEGEVTFKGTIIEVVDERDVYIPKSEIVSKLKFLKTRIKVDGEYKEVIVKYSGASFSNKKIIVGRVIDKDGKEIYLFRSINRLSLYVSLLLLFILVSFLVIGKKAIRPLLSLFAGIMILIFIMVPSLLNADHLIFQGILMSFLLLFFTLVITHGFKRDTYIAFIGIILGLCITILLTYISITSGSINGFSLETSILLGYVSSIKANFQHVLLLSIMIGMFGILDDIAVTQVSIVRELKKHAPHLSKKNIFVSALNVGRDHASALVNTLFFAYGGVVLPAIMFVYASHYPFNLAISQELFAIEIVRAIAGSVGFLLIIPITTIIATLYSKPEDGENSHIHHH